MLNPLLFIPSIVTSIANVIISYSLMSANIIGRTYAMLSYNMPSVLVRTFRPETGKQYCSSSY